MALPRNIAQIYADNPSTTLTDDDLVYVGLTPEGVGDDSAIKKSDLYNQFGVAYQLTTPTLDFSVGQNGSLFNITNNATPTSGDVLYSVDQDGNHNFNAGGTFAGIFNVNNSLAYHKFYLAGGSRYNDDLSLSASQSGTTVTGSGTAFNTNMQGGLIYWPSSGSIKKIEIVSSSTSLTVSASNTQTNAPFIIYFPGYNYDYLTNIFNIANLNTKSIDTYIPYTTLNIGQDNATLIQLGRAGSLTYVGESFYAGQSYNSNLSLSASQSGATVTGTATTFISAMTNGKIFWPSTGNTANIITVDSTTQLTVDDSFSQTNAPFFIYYSGIGVSPSQVAMSPLVPFLVNKIDTDATYTVLDIGLTNATLINLNTITSFNNGIKRTLTSVTTATYAVLPSDNYLSVNRAGVVTITMPSTVTNQTLIISDASNAAFTNNITINGNGHNIAGAATIVINSNSGSITLTGDTVNNIWLVS